MARCLMRVGVQVTEKLIIGYWSRRQMTIGGMMRCKLSLSGLWRAAY